MHARILVPVLLVIASSFSSSSVLAVEDVNELNVVMIVIDDLRPELACYGEEGVKAPNLDRLAESGLRFDRAYCQQAVCGASRLSVMSGVYPTATREQSYHVRQWRKRYPNLVTMNQHFRDHGFQTFGVGKVYHSPAGSDADATNWDRWETVPGAVYVDPANLAMSRAFSVHDATTKRGSLFEALDVEDSAYPDGKRAAKAVQMLSDLARSGERFFMAVGFSKPHLPFVAPKRYWDLYAQSQFEMPSNTGIPQGYPEFAANLTGWELEFYLDYEGKHPRDFSDALNRRLLHGYAACTSYVDACVGQVLGELERTGLAEKTIVVVWGDHGWKLGDHSSWSKHTNFECDTRVPLIMRVPDKANHKSTSSLVELIDLYPTLCDLTGIATPAGCQGKSFAALFDNPSAEHREAAYSAYPAEEGVSERQASGMIDAPPSQSPLMGVGHSIRFDDYRYTEWRVVDSSSPVAAVLTNLATDPGEQTNIIDAPEYQSALTRAKALLEKRIRAAKSP